MKLANARIPQRLPRCPMVPTRFTKLKCWKGCLWWNVAEKRCEKEVRDDRK